MRNQTDQRHVHRGQCLMRRKDDDTGPAVTHGVDRDLFAHHERIVYAGRVTHAEQNREIRHLDVEVG